MQNRKLYITLLIILLAFCVIINNHSFAGNLYGDNTKNSQNQLFYLVANKNKISKTNDSIAVPVHKSLFQNFLSGLNLGGYYRGYFYSKYMNQKYGDVGVKKTINVGDGYYDPTLFLYIGGTPTPNTSFGTEVIIANPFELYRGPGYQNNGNVNPYFTAVLRGTIATDWGNFSAIAGGIEWLRLTPFTFGSNIGFNRFSTFERKPWDPVGNIKTRYASYYYNGNINQDSRWGTQAFKGFILNGFLKNINTNIDIFFGKTAPNGGINREDVTAPSQNLGIRIKKNIDQDNYYSLNTFNSFNSSDSINKSNDIQWNIFTSEFQFKKNDIQISGEIGGGRYMSPNYKEGWSEGVMLDLSLPKKLSFIPLMIRYFQIGKNFTSNVANFNNTSIAEINTGFVSNTSSGKGKGTPVNTPFGSSLDNVGDIANNRRGVALNTNFKVSKFMCSIGSQISGEMEVMSSGNLLNFGHRINSLVWSRLPGAYPLYSKFGPNNRVGSYYRGAYESVKLSDTTSSGFNQFRKYYNAIDFQAKYKSKIFDKDIYINYLSTYSSAQNEFSAFVKFNNQAYIRAQYHEIDIDYQVHKNFIIAIYGGLELIKGNQYTDLNSEGKARDQVGKAIGIGFDCALSAQTALFFRQRWFSFEDKNFINEKFSGNEGTIELKIYF